jgi:hypothetical protein
MDDIQRAASLLGRHCIALDDPLHADDEIRVATIQQIDPFVTLGDQSARATRADRRHVRPQSGDRSTVPVGVVFVGATDLCVRSYGHRPFDRGGAGGGFHVLKDEDAHRR